MSAKFIKLIIVNHRCWCCRHSFDTEAEPASPPPHQVEFRASLPTTNKHLIKPQVEKLRRISTGSMKIEVTGEKTSLDSHVTSFKKCKQVYFESGEGGIYRFLKNLTHICTMLFREHNISVLSYFG